MARRTPPSRPTTPGFSPPPGRGATVATFAGVGHDVVWRPEAQRLIERFGALVAWRRKLAAMWLAFLKRLHAYPLLELGSG